MDGFGILFVVILVYGSLIAIPICIAASKRAKEREEEQKIDAFREHDPDTWLRLKEMKHQEKMMDHQKKMLAEEKKKAGINAGVKVGSFIANRFLKK